MSLTALEKIQQFNEKHGKPATLRFVLGAWATESLRNGSPLNADTLKQWADNNQLSAAEKLVINELLEEIQDCHSE